MSRLECGKFGMCDRVDAKLIPWFMLIHNANFTVVALGHFMFLYIIFADKILLLLNSWAEREVSISWWDVNLSNDVRRWKLITKKRDSTLQVVRGYFQRRNIASNRSITQSIASHCCFIYKSVIKEWKLYLSTITGTLHILAWYSKRTENHKLCSKQKILRIFN